MQLPDIMVPSRGHRNKRPILLLGGIVVVAALMVPASSSGTDRVAQAWWDFAHVPALALLSWAWMSSLRTLAPLPTFVGCLLLTPLIELIQPLTGREASWVDLGYGWLGCLSGGWLYWTAGERRRFWGAGFLLVVALYHPVRVTWDRLAAHHAFPELSAFRGSFERSRWVVTGCEIEERGEGGWDVRIGGDAPYPGLFLRDGPMDWRNMDFLHLDIEVLDGQPLPAWLRVDDQPDDPPYAERFQQPIMLAAGRQEVRIPVEALIAPGDQQLLDLSRIHTAGIFFSEEETGRLFRLYRLFLTPSLPSP